MDKLYLSQFMLTQFWRLPLNRPVVDKYMNKNNLSFIGLSLNKDGKMISNQDETDFYKKIKGTELFQKTYSSITGLTRSMNNGAYDDLVD